MPHCTLAHHIVKQVLPPPHVKSFRFYRNYRLYLTWNSAIGICFCINGSLAFFIWSYLIGSIFFDWIILDVLVLKESAILRKKGLETFNGFPPDQLDRYVNFSKYARRGCFSLALFGTLLNTDHFKEWQDIQDLFWMIYSLSFMVITYGASYLKIAPCPFPEKFRIGGNSIDHSAYQSQDFYGHYSSYSMREACLGY